MQNQTHDRRSGQISITELSAKIMQPVEQKQAKTKRNKWKPEFARFKCKCYYKDGNSSVHYSYDMYHKYTDGMKQRITDENEGMTKLITYILSVQHKIKTAVIWVTFEKEKGTEIAKYNDEVFKGINKNGKFENANGIPLRFDSGCLDLFRLKKILVENMERSSDVR